MEATGLLDTGEVLTRIEAALDAVDHEARSGVPAQQRLAWGARALRVAGRVQALANALLAEVDRTSAAQQAFGSSAATWLSSDGQLSGRQAQRVLGRACDAARYPEVERAVLDGRVGVEKVAAVTTLLDRVPREVSDEARQQVTERVLGFADTHDASAIMRHAEDLLAEVMAESALDAERRREREYAQARRERFLSFTPGGRGSTIVRGSLPTVDAEPLMAALAAMAEAARKRYDERHDLAAPTSGQRLADALCALAAQGSDAGVVRPRLLVTMSVESLRRLGAEPGTVARQQDAPARLSETGEPVPVGVLRRLCCDAEFVPVVLGGRSEVLDVGRAHRLVTPAIRTALIVRDGGCVFPGCDARPRDCEAHHIVPWQQGGATSVKNLVLLCRHHHGLIEPGVEPNPHRWELRLAEDGVPEFLPPLRVDRERRPRRHARLELLEDTG